MGRQRRLRNHLVKLATACFSLCSCINLGDYDQSDVMQDITIQLGGYEFITKSADPDENKITDISLMVFDKYGSIEAFKWIQPHQINEVLRNGLKLRLATGKSYSFFGCVNFGYKVYADTIAELAEIKYHLIYPDDFRNGIPMCISQESVQITPDLPIVLPIKRLMSKISLKIDRSRLNKDVKFNVIKAHIGNCPKRVQVFEESRVKDESDCFPAGYSKNEFDTNKMNNYNAVGISGEVSLFMLENMQGTIDSSDINEKDFPEGDIRRKTCSYIEIDIEYISSDKASWSKPLKYRFYLGEHPKDLNVERNCHYHITIKPENDGLSKDGWCIDKSGLCTFIKEIQLTQNSLNFEYEGENFLLETKILPQEASFQQLSWSSSNNKVAEVSDNGLITATGEGSCTIRCTSTDGAGASAECNVICKFKDCYLNLFPQNYIVGNIGDKIHIWCEFFPPNTPFNVGLEELEFDKNRGIYDYIIDKDGHGVVLSLKKPGRGMLYMSAGYPINDSKMVVIEVNQP